MARESILKIEESQSRKANNQILLKNFSQLAHRILYLSESSTLGLLDFSSPWLCARVAPFSAVRLDQLAQAGAERRQVILPTVHSGAHRELRIALLYVLLEVNAHAGHGLQVFHYRSADGFTDNRAILSQLLHGRNELRFQGRVVHGQQQMGVTPFVHQVADALVHGHSD